VAHRKYTSATRNEPAVIASASSIMSAVTMNQTAIAIEIGQIRRAIPTAARRRRSLASSAGLKRNDDGSSGRAGREGYSS
jgi:hypothetical protein